MAKRSGLKPSEFILDEVVGTADTLYSMDPIDKDALGGFFVNDGARFTWRGTPVDDQRISFSDGVFTSEPAAPRPLVRETIARAIVVPLEGRRVGIYCPYCGHGDLRDKIVMGLRSGQDETCVCAKRYELPNFRALAIDPEGLRELAMQALKLASELEESAPG